MQLSEKKVKLFIDFDGTLVDSRERLYNLFQFLVPSSNYTFDEYWERKKKGVSHKLILIQEFNYSEEKSQDFHSSWMNLIEKPEWIRFDKPYSDVTKKLIELKSAGNSLILVTARQFPDVLNEQLVKFDWTYLFDQVLVTKQSKTKVELIRAAIDPEKNDWFIGDTGKDIETGKELGIKTAAVLTGFLSRTVLQKYNPDIIIESFNEFPVLENHL